MITTYLDVYDGYRVLTHGQSWGVVWNGFQNLVK